MFKILPKQKGLIMGTFLCRSDSNEFETHLSANLYFFANDSGMMECWFTGTGVYEICATLLSRPDNRLLLERIFHLLITLLCTLFDVAFPVYIYSYSTDE